MREFTKSAFSTGLAMSLFGIRQIMNAMRRPGPGQSSPATDAFNAVTDSMVEQCGDSVRETFYAGDKVQRELVDLTFRFLSLQPLRSTNGSASFADATRQTAEQFRRWINGMTGRGCGCRGADGDDPMASAQWPGDPATPWAGGQSTRQPGDAFAPPYGPAAARQGSAVETGWGPVPPMS